MILRDHGFHRSDYDSEWNVFWCAGQCDTARFADLKPHQRVNKFPRASALTLKANLWTNFLRMQERFGAEHFGYMPQTCVLPAQIDVLDRWMAAPENAEGVRASATPPAAAGPPPAATCRARDDAAARPPPHRQVWILKPAAAYCGKGITLHRSLAPLSEALRTQRGVACRYIHPPYLVGGLKSDIRCRRAPTSRGAHAPSSSDAPRARCPAAGCTRS